MFSKSMSTQCPSSFQNPIQPSNTSRLSQPIPPTDDAYTVNFTQDEIILLYNVLGSYQTSLQTAMNCVLQSQIPEIDDMLGGCQNIRRKIFMISGLV